MRIPRKPPELSSLLTGQGASAVQRLLDALQAIADGRLQAAGAPDYPHWDELRHQPAPAGMSHEDWWLALKLQRSAGRRSVPLEDSAGRSGIYTLPDVLLQQLQSLDTRLKGHLALSDQVTDPAQRDRYIVSALMEEAISSSQLEGAATTHRVAKDMLRTERPPRTHGERMILNNYLGMRFVRDHQTRPLTRSLVRELHEVLTHDTIEPPDAAGRFRRADEAVVVRDNATQELLHTPPAAGQIEDRLTALLGFANGSSAEGFIHPIVRAIVTHYWLSYDHPFVDGNGRTARALFYWVMLRSGYWLTEYISLSSIARRSPAEYARAFLYVETDSNDLTYFLIQQLRALRLAVDALDAYLKRKRRELDEVEQTLRADRTLNHRQLTLLAHALRHADAQYTMASHGASHRVVYATARSDLLDLVSRGLLSMRRIGRKHVFRSTAKLQRRQRRTA